MERTWGSVRGVCAFLLLVAMEGCSQTVWPTTASLSSGGLASEFHPVLKLRPPRGEYDRQCECADQVVTRLARRDRLDTYLLTQEVQLEPSYRIRVFFVFREDMRGVMPRLKRFWKFPRWIGGGRYASTYGHGQPGFEIHLDPEDPTRTVGLNAHKSSDVDEHEPAGGFKSIALHVVNVVQHKFGQREKPPCDLLADLPAPQEATPTILANEAK